MDEHLEACIKGLIPDPGQETSVEADPAGFTDRVPIGNPRPLLWRDWVARFANR